MCSIHAAAPALDRIGAGLAERLAAGDVARDRAPASASRSARVETLSASRSRAVRAATATAVMHAVRAAGQRAQHARRIGGVGRLAEDARGRARRWCRRTGSAPAAGRARCRRCARRRSFGARHALARRRAGGSPAAVLRAPRRPRRASAQQQFVAHADWLEQLRAGAGSARRGRRSRSIAAVDVIRGDTDGSALIDQARYSCSASSTRTNACGRVRSDRRSVSSALRLERRDRGRRGRRSRSATSRPSLLPGLQPLRRAPRGQARAALVERDAARAVRQRRLDALASAAISCAARLAAARLGLDRLQLEPQLRRQALGVVGEGGLGPGRQRWPTATSTSFMAATARAARSTRRSRRRRSRFGAVFLAARPGAACLARRAAAAFFARRLDGRLLRRRLPARRPRLRRPALRGASWPRLAGDAARLSRPWPALLGGGVFAAALLAPASRLLGGASPVAAWSSRAARRRRLVGRPSTSRPAWRRASSAPACRPRSLRGGSTRGSPAA